MAYVIGTLLALAVSAYATMLRLDRDRAFYPTVLAWRLTREPAAAAQQLETRP